MTDATSSPSTPSGRCDRRGAGGQLWPLGTPMPLVPLVYTIWNRVMLCVACSADA